MKEKSKSKLKLVNRFLKGSKLLFILSAILTCITALADMVIPQIIRFTVDGIIGGKEECLPKFIIKLTDNFGGTEFLKSRLWIISIFIIGIAVIKVISQYLFKICNTCANETLSKTVRDSLFTKIAHLPYSWHLKNKTGDIIQRCTSDILTMNRFLSDELTGLFKIVILLILSVTFMLKMNVWLALIALSIFPAIIFNSLFFDKRIQKGFDAFNKNESILSSIVQENLSGARVVRAFGREQSEYKKFETQNGKLTEIGCNIGRIFGKFFYISEILSGIQIMSVIVFGALFCVTDRITAGEYIAFVSYNSTLIWPLNELGRMITELGKTNVAVDRIKFIMDSSETQDNASEKPSLKGDIEFKNVSFGFSENTPVLKNISFTVKGGSTLGILGGTGSGKSTLMLLLDKIYPLGGDSGKITISGIDINEINTEYLRKNIGTVLQDPYLFSRTIKENIGITDDNTDSERIKSASEAACLDSAVNGFSKGYETFVGERGVTLSGGQKQRVAIARILTRNTPIIIFDDSLSAVDTETDAKIRKSIEKLYGNATVILISHRISTLCKADSIIVLEDGKITERGTHKELISKNGIYRRIYGIQNCGKEAIQ